MQGRESRIRSQVVNAWSSTSLSIHRVLIYPSRHFKVLSKRGWRPVWPVSRSQPLVGTPVMPPTDFSAILPWYETPRRPGKGKARENVLQLLPFHENSTLIGVYQSRQGARAAAVAHAQRPLQWNCPSTGSNVEYALAMDQTRYPMNDDTYNIHVVNLLP